MAGMVNSAIKCTPKVNPTIKEINNNQRFPVGSSISSSHFNPHQNSKAIKNDAMAYTSASTALYQKFNPIINNSFKKVGADKIWADLITKYNNLPLTADVNPDLTDYVTNEALKGVFTMVEVEERGIRANIAKRTSDLLKRVFGMLQYLNKYHNYEQRT